MKKLLLIRHAKATHDTSYDDFERPLKHSGIRDAEVMAERLVNAGLIPQMLITSPALRTQATADIFSQILPVPKPAEDERIYEASRLAIVDIISQFDDQYNFIGIVGHNPAMEQIVHYLTDEMIDFPPGAVAYIEFKFDNWELVSGDMGTLKWHSSPKEH